MSGGIEVVDGSLFSIDADLGAGNDEFAAIFEQGWFVRANSLAEIEVNGDAGNEVISAHFNFADFEIDDSSIARLWARGGDGDDVLQITADPAPSPAPIPPPPGDPAFPVVGDPVFLDPVSVDAHLTAWIAGLWDVLLNGDRGNDAIHADLSGRYEGDFELSGRFRLRADGGAGNDVMTFDLSNTNTSDGDYDIIVLGSGGNDDITSVIVDLTGGNDPSSEPIMGYGPLGAALVDGGVGGDDIGRIFGNGRVIRRNFERAR